MGCALEIPKYTAEKTGLPRFFLCLQAGVSQHPVEPFKDDGEQDYKKAAENRKPEIRHPFVIPANNNDDLRNNCRNKYRIPPDKLKEKGQQEYAQHITIEDRPYYVYQLDQIIE
jgi:hypothetical protein